MRWMYPFERLMKMLKGYVRNRNCPERCIVESYLAKKIIEFCSEYIGDAKTISMPTTRNTGNKGIGVGNPKFMACDDWELAHRNVLEILHQFNLTLSKYIMMFYFYEDMTYFIN